MFQCALRQCFVGRTCSRPIGDSVGERLAAHETAPDRRNDVGSSGAGPAERSGPSSVLAGAWAEAHERPVRECMEPHRAPAHVAVAEQAAPSPGVGHRRLHVHRPRDESHPARPEDSRRSADIRACVCASHPAGGWNDPGSTGALEGRQRSRMAQRMGQGDERRAVPPSAQRVRHIRRIHSPHLSRRYVQAGATDSAHS